MKTRFKQTKVALVAIATCIAACGISAVPAGARVTEKNTKFCAAIGSDQGAGIDFEGLGPQEAAFAAKLERKLAKTGVPTKLKKDLGKLARVYDRIAKGESAAEVLDAAGQAAILPALTRFSKYFAANCVEIPPST